MAWEDYWKQVDGEYGWVDDGFGDLTWGPTKSTGWNTASGYASPEEYLTKTRGIPAWMAQFVDKARDANDAYNRGTTGTLDAAGFALPNAYFGGGFQEGQFNPGWMYTDDGEGHSEFPTRKAFLDALAQQAGAAHALPVSDLIKSYQNGLLPKAGIPIQEMIQKLYQNPRIVDVPGVGQVLAAEGENRYDWGLGDNSSFWDDLVNDIVPAGLKMYGLMTGIGSLGEFALGNIGALGDAATGIDSLADFNGLTPGDYADLGGTLGAGAGAATGLDPSLWDPSTLQSPVVPVSDAGFDPQSMSGIENPANYGNLENIQELYDLGNTLPGTMPPPTGIDPNIPQGGMPNPGMPHPGLPVPTEGEISIPGTGGAPPASPSWISQFLKVLGVTNEAGTTTSSPLLQGAGALLSYFQDRNRMDTLNDTIRSAADKADPFASQRGFYQDKLKQSYMDPNFFQNDPVFSGIRRTAMSDVERAAAARGYNNSSNVLHNVGSRINDEGMKYANLFQGQLAQNAGAGFSPGTGAGIQAQGAQLASGIQNSSNANIGSFLQQLPGIAKQFGLT
jgi:hypothetical protein